MFFHFFWASQTISFRPEGFAFFGGFQAVQNSWIVLDPFGSGRSVFEARLHQLIGLDYEGLIPQTQLDVFSSQRKASRVNVM